jgi:hypothetical protein
MMSPVAQTIGLPAPTLPPVPASSRMAVVVVPPITVVPP